MKKLIIALCLFVLPGFALADTITLDSPQALTSPTAAKISEWKIILIDAQAKHMRIQYRWRDATNKLVNIGLDRQGWIYWNCRDIEVYGTNAECIDSGDPYVCCTGAGTGTCDDMLDTCFSDVFGFSIRTQDVGTKIGIGLRTLIWNQMKQDILTGGNDGAFD